MTNTYTYPIYKKYKMQNGSYIFVKFTSLKEATCLKHKGDVSGWKIGKTESTVEHTSTLWQNWEGPQTLKIYKVKQ